MQNFKTLRQPLLGELAMSPEEEEEEKKMPFIVATYVYASSQGQRTHSARTNNEQDLRFPVLFSHFFKTDKVYIYIYLITPVYLFQG